MLVGLLSDAHGNSVGLAACLQALDALGVRQLFFLGDAVGYFPRETDVLRLLSDRSVACQQGNHEAVLLHGSGSAADREAIYRHGDARERLGTSGLEQIAAWPVRREISIDSRRILLVHGTPDDWLEGRSFQEAEERRFEASAYDAVFMGHTHRPFVRERNSKLVMNVGSCGMPRDQGDAPSFAVYDTASHTAEILRIRIDPWSVLRSFDGAPISEQARAVLFRTADRPIIGRFLQS